MSIRSSPSLVLQAFRYSETSKILRLYTRDLGLRSVIAKGALRPKSRFGGLLEPFTEGISTIYLREGRDLLTLSGFDLVRSRQSLGQDLAAFAGASLVAELLLRFTTEDPNPRLYTLAGNAWDEIAAAAGHDRLDFVILAAAWRVVVLLGFGPRLDACVSCGSAVQGSRAVRFNIEEGGVACARCRPGGRGIPEAALHELAELLAGAWSPAGPHQTAELQRDLFRSYTLAHLAHDRPLRSWDLLLQHLASR